jgi:hypothetical protein
VRVGIFLVDDRDGGEGTKVWNKVQVCGRKMNSSEGQWDRECERMVIRGCR